jgi:hypothetical protein
MNWAFFMSEIFVSLSVNDNEIDAFHNSYDLSELDYSDFDFYRINLPDGSTRIFSDEKSFFDFCDSISAYCSARSSFINSVFSPSVLTSAVSTVLGVSPPPVLSSF